MSSSSSSAPTALGVASDLLRRLDALTRDSSTLVRTLPEGGVRSPVVAAPGACCSSSSLVEAYRSRLTDLERRGREAESAMREELAGLQNRLNHAIRESQSLVELLKAREGFVAPLVAADRALIDSILAPSSEGSSRAVEALAVRREQAFKLQRATGEALEETRRVGEAARAEAEQALAQCASALRAVAVHEERQAFHAGREAKAKEAHDALYAAQENLQSRFGVTVAENERLRLHVSHVESLFADKSRSCEELKASLAAAQAAQAGATATTHLQERALAGLRAELEMAKHKASHRAPPNVPPPMHPGPPPPSSSSSSSVASRSGSSPPSAEVAAASDAGLDQVIETAAKQSIEEPPPLPAEPDAHGAQ